ncbi:mTERF [Musa troglodytarum]|uniref:mTERF n=1 Tax=Musa troglodytarum TaxID=320322 RepID=A0A9E7EYH7_9LILI|nr:mTERF [Musa troglodytarum]
MRRAMRLGPSAWALFSRLLSTSPPRLKNLRYHYRARALAEAQRFLTDYLHCTGSLPFSHAESIASNSPFTLSDLVSQLPLPPDAVAADVKVALGRFLAYRPINEFEFFFESIGLPPSSSPAAASYRSIFLSDETRLLASVSALVHFGFPWTKLGLLYREEPSIFSSGPDCLVARLRALEARGFYRVCVIGICLAFPSALSADAEPGGEMDLLFRDLKTVFVDFSLAGCVTENDVDVFLQVSRRIRVFYDLGSRKGTMGELMGRNREIFVTVDEAVIAKKLKYLINLGMEEQKVGPFILGCPDLLGFDLENPSVAMPEYLNHVGLDKNEVTSLSQRYPYVMGKNKLGNLPGMMRAMDLHSWFLSRILDGNYHYLSSSFVSAAPHDTAIESGFLQALDRVKRLKMEQFVDNKLEFLLGIGFGENEITVRMLSLINGTKNHLQERFDRLLGMGIEYSMLCRMVSGTPKLLNRSNGMLQKKN